MSKLLIIFITLIVVNLPVFSSELTDCGNNEQAHLLATLIKTDKEQKRKKITCNRLLTTTAETKAKKMAETGLVIHNLGGSPNSRLRDAGYKLPDHYGFDINSNQVEAIAGGYSNAKRVWNAFKRSDAHRTHLLGEHEFYLEQDEIGIAFISEWETPHVEYWVVYLTKGYQKDQTSPVDIKEIPNKSMFILQKVKQEKSID